MPFHFGGILQLLILGLIIYFTVRMFRRPVGTCGHGAAGADEAEDTLRQRYAKGEIDTQTFHDMKKELGKP